MPTADSRILSRSDCSLRVRRLLSAALRRVLANQLNTLVSKEEADLLARSYTPATVLEPYEKQKTVKRIGLAQEESVAVATWIVASDGVRSRAQELSNEDRRELDARLASAFQEVHQLSHKLSAAKGFTSSKDREIVELGRRVEAFGPQFRHFIRRADRLWSKQVSTLRIFIDDVNACDAAITKLARVYQTAFEAAIRLGDRSRNLNQ
jgi:hypothetical protein